MKNVIIMRNVIALAFVLSACSSSKNVTATEWASKPIVVDAKLDDWKQPLSEFSSSAKLGYSLTNDEDYLYLCFTTSHRPTMMKIAMSGFNIAIDTLGKKKKHITIKLMPEVVLAKMPEIASTGINVTGANNLPVDEIKVKGGYASDNSLVYEVALPLKKLTKSNPRQLGITFNIEGLPEPGMPGGGGMQGPPPGGGMGGPGGGGPMGGPGGPGGPGRPSGGDMSQMSSDQKIHFVIQLASGR